MKKAPTQTTTAQRWTQLLNNKIPQDLVIDRLIPLLLSHDTLALIAQTNLEGSFLGNDHNLWMKCALSRGWAKEFSEKQEFKNVLHGLNQREKQRRCDWTTLKHPLVHYYHPKKLYKTRHHDQCDLCDFPGADGVAILANLRICKECFSAGRESSKSSNFDLYRPIRYNIISQSDAQKKYLVTKKGLESVPCGTVTLTMGAKANLYSERICQEKGWARYGGEDGFLVEILKRQKAADAKKQKKESDGKGRKKKKSKQTNGWERPGANYQYSNALQVIQLLDNGLTN